MPSQFTRRNRDFFQGADGPSYDKFSTKNKPSKRMFRWLFESVGFLKESSDTAQTDVQGYVQLNTDTESSARTSSKGANGYAKVVQAHQLPLVVSDTLNVDGHGSSKNGIQIKVVDSTYSRTGGKGLTFIVKNTMKLSADDSLSFIVPVQESEGEDIVLTFQSDNFNTEIENSEVINTINQTINTVIQDVASGYLGEIKMYSFFNEFIGGTNCEFNAYGVGRAAGVNGASGNWAGWIILNGQTYATLLAAPYNANATVLARIKNGSVIVNTKQSYPTGLGTTSGENKGFDINGDNSHILIANETPLRNHNHSLSDISITLTPAGAHYHAYNIAGGGLQFDNEAALANPHNDGATKHTSETPAHEHTATFTGAMGSTQELEANAHNNRPLSFGVCYAMYVGTNGSLN